MGEAKLRTASEIPTQPTRVCHEFVRRLSLSETVDRRGISGFSQLIATQSNHLLRTARRSRGGGPNVPMGGDADIDP
jgi:hypothetical protein